MAVTVDDPHQVVIDACVAVKWCLRDEGFVSEADQLLDDAREKRILPIVPSLFDYEISNVMLTAVRGNRLSPEQAQRFLRDLQEMEFVRVDDHSLCERWFSLGRALDCSVYDVSYVVLAQSCEVPFVTGDRRLLRKISSEFTNAHWVGDYSLEIFQ
jgi:predicted nucleic acid-binding protein